MTELLTFVETNGKNCGAECNKIVNCTCWINGCIELEKDDKGYIRNELCLTMERMAKIELKGVESNGYCKGLERSC